MGQGGRRGGGVTHQPHHVQVSTIGDASKHAIGLLELHTVPVAALYTCPHCVALLLTHHLQPQPLLCCVIGVVTADCLQSGVGCE